MPWCPAKTGTLTHTLLSLSQLLGFPIQLLGLVMLPYLGVRWFVDGKKASADIGDATVRG